MTHHVTAMLHVCFATMSCLTVDDRNVLQDVESLACSNTEFLLFACNFEAIHKHQQTACMVQDPVGGLPAVLVKRYNITQTMESEHKASQRQSSLEK